MASALVKSGYDVACFGIKAEPRDVADELPYRVWPAERGGHWTDSLPQFFASIQPRALLLPMDAYNALECVTVCRAAGWSGPTVSYVCFDGLPVGRAYLDSQGSCASVWTTSQVGAAYLSKEGIDVAGVAPPGVDRSVFRPLPNRAALRERVGLSGATVVGVFATNTQRKEVARALAGFAQLVESLPDVDLRLYLHCRPQGFWNLAELAQSWGVGDRVLFPTAEDFEEHRGVPTDDGAEAPPPPGSLAGLSYVERLNCCDVLLNVPNSGDMEHVIIEGQACGVPVVNTDDEGVMAEALGEAGLKLPASDVGIGRIGQRLHHVAPARIAHALSVLLSKPDLQDSLRTAGLANAAAHPWSVLEEAACAMVRPYIPARNG
jgi:glycosyltransferase involved in cell wall biosynthesis